MVGSTKEVVEKWFDDYEKMMEATQYHRSLLLNFDETSVNYAHKPKKVVVSTENKSGVVPGVKASYKFTLGVTISADGTMPDPMFVLAGKTLPYLPEDLKELGKYFYQENGSVDQTILTSYLQDVIIPWLVTKRQSIKDLNARALIVIDNHKSRYYIPLLQLLKDNNIDMLFLPPNSTHILQPLDVCVFGPFKSALSSKLTKRLNSEDKLAVLRVKLIETAHECLQSVSTRLTIKKSFMLTGILPVNRDVVLSNSLVGECPSSLLARQKKTIEKSTLTGEMMLRRLENIQLEKEKQEKEKEERKKKRKNKVSEKNNHEDINNPQKKKKRGRPSKVGSQTQTETELEK